MNRPQHTISGILGPMMKKDSKPHIPLDAEFGQKVFVNGRWIKRGETQSAKPATPDPGRDRLDLLEKKVITNFSEATEAIREIKEKKLYLLVADSWQAYCEERLGRSKQAVWKLLKMLEIPVKMLEIPEGKRSTKVDDRLLIPKDLSAQADTLDMEIIEPVAAPIPARKLAPDFRIKLGRETEKAMPEKSIAAEPEEADLLDELITRIRRSRNNKAFLKALKEWLDQSGNLT